MSHPRNGPLYHELTHDLYETVREMVHDDVVARTAVGYDVPTAS